MSHRFDAVVKDLLGQSAADLAPLFHFPSGPCTALNIELSTVSAASDVAFAFGDPFTEIVDINFQAGPDANVDARLLFYSALYYNRHAVPVRTILILLRRQADHARLTGLLAYHAGGSRVEFEYEMMRMWQQPPAPFLTGSLTLLPLATLCQMPADVPLDEAIKLVVQQIDQRLLLEAPYALAAKLMTGTFILAGSRITEMEVLQNIFKGVRVMFDSTAFTVFEEKGRQEGIQIGRQEGMQLGRQEEKHLARQAIFQVLLKLGAQHFGPPDQGTVDLLAVIEDYEIIAKLCNAVYSSRSWQELLSQRQ